MLVNPTIGTAGDHFFSLMRPKTLTNSSTALITRRLSLSTTGLRQFFVDHLLSIAKYLQLDALASLMSHLPP